MASSKHNDHANDAISGRNVIQTKGVGRVSKRDDLLESIANTIADYRKGEIPKPTPNHVDRWIRQFDDADQIPLLGEVDHVFKRTYFAKAKTTRFFANQIEHKQIAGEYPLQFWQDAHLLNIQQQGSSQKEIRELFIGELRKRCNLDLTNCGSAGGSFIYLDDVLFSGSRVWSDLSKWIADEAPAKSILHIIVIATHHYGEWSVLDRLKNHAVSTRKQLELHCWAAARIENRRKYRDASAVLWPVSIPKHAALEAYIAKEKKFPFEPRNPGKAPEPNIFSSEENRQLLERALLIAGMRIRTYSHAPNPALRPLGFGGFGLGFGSMIVTFRNCPNNCPPALWWGDPDADFNHPLSKWYPLLPRKTYTKKHKEMDENDIKF